MLYAKYMHSEKLVTEHLVQLNTNAETETDSCPQSQGFDYTYVIDNTISEKNNDRRNYFRPNFASGQFVFRYRNWGSP